jgi:hypothetical protein
VELFTIKELAGTIQKVMLLTIKPVFIRPRVTVRAKKSNSDDHEKIQITPDPEPNSAKKFIMDIFKIKEIDYEKFRKESKWAIRPNKKD